MKHNNKHFNLEFGGMLMELMLSLALASIMIPFVVKYQKNTIERARNIAIVKQMETVQAALERCIFENRSTILNQGVSVLSENIDPHVIDCLILSNYDEDNPLGLVNYGLTHEFANDFRDDYRMRILKTADNTGQPVLQGVVLLNNQNITALRTREIVRLGGGKVGFLEEDGDHIHGGFNAFNAEKIRFDFNAADTGIVQTTDTMRGESKYLWRVPSTSVTDATMLSDLNLDGHDVNNIGNLFAKDVFLSNLYLDGTSQKNQTDVQHMQFINNATIKGTTCVADYADVHGDMVSVLGNVLQITDTEDVGRRLLLEGDECGEEGLYAKFNNISASNIFSSSDISVSGNYSICAKDLTVDTVFSPRISELLTLTTFVKGDKVITPRLVIERRMAAMDSVDEFTKILSDPDYKPTYYWEQPDPKDGVIHANMNDVILAGVPGEVWPVDAFSDLKTSMQQVIELEKEYFYEYDHGTNGGKGSTSIIPDGEDLQADPGLYKKLYTTIEFLNKLENTGKLFTVSTALDTADETEEIVYKKYGLMTICAQYGGADPKYVGKNKELLAQALCASHGLKVLNQDIKYGKKLLPDFESVMNGCIGWHGPEGGSAYNGSLSGFTNTKTNAIQIQHNLLFCLNCASDDYLGGTDSHGNKKTDLCLTCVPKLINKEYGSMEACMKDVGDASGRQ